jgi:L-iditol 2-dehydrogenase
MVLVIRQAFVPEIGRVAYRDVEVSDPGPGQVLMRPARIGICGSDVHVYKGEHPIVAPPLVQGHEVSGTVVTIGPGVGSIAPGDIVVIEPAIGCGVCERCRSGLMAQCADLHFIGGDLDGPAGGAYIVDVQQLVRMAPTTSLDDAAMTEPLACAVHAVRRAGSVSGRDVLVAGGGPIGALVAQVCQLKGARTVFVSDPSEGRRRVLESCDISTLDPREGLGRLIDRLEGRRLDVAFECSGAERGLADCLTLLARGATLVVVAVYPEPPRVDMVAVQDHELDVHGSLMYTWEDFREAAGLIDGGLMRLHPLQTHHVPFEGWADGYRLIDDPTAGTMKVLVDVT